MTRAFTHLTEKINFSLYKNTLTIYPKSKDLPSIDSLRSKQPWEVMTVLMEVMRFEECQAIKVNSALKHVANQYNVKRFVHREDTDHSCYHRDDFDWDADHYHAQFAVSITPGLLNKILLVFEKYMLITKEERERFIKAYHEANVLPSKEPLGKSQEAILLPFAATAVHGKTVVEEPVQVAQDIEKEPVLKPKPHEIKFEAQLSDLSKKVEDFKRASRKDPQTYQAAYNEAKTLHEKLNENYVTYQQHKDGKLFVANANSIIDKARGELENHRGVKKYIVDFVERVQGFIAQFGDSPAQKVNQRPTFFKTDSIRKLEALTETVQAFSFDA
ncbi:hypothetical protein GH742_01435 [Legionella sp. MW5194]|uniref:hypothetical protein n=1 Tax=Legionella sp. MW5194 TaxID=2662448 RepID=UPI00193CB1BD|nr:hypothetical protein [Legionella sp. MW5194]QRN02643.1 hypothetical protein GH742_01435 [Legionella sp. MW5194]